MVDRITFPTSEIDQRAQAAAEVLHGGWRIEHGLVHTVVLTLSEAEAVALRLKKFEKTTLDVDVIYKRMDEFGQRTTKDQIKAVMYVMGLTPEE